MEHEEEVTCEACSGTGYLDKLKTVECNNCDGTGTIRVTVWSSEDEILYI